MTNKNLIKNKLTPFTCYIWLLQDQSVDIQSFVVHCSIRWERAQAREGSDHVSGNVTGQVLLSNFVIYITTQYYGRLRLLNV